MNGEAPGLVSEGFLAGLRGGGIGGWGSSEPDEPRMGEGVQLHW